MKIGDKINYWTVISTDAPPEHRYHVLCRCICGKEKWVNCSALRLGKSKSCGCQRKRNQKEYDLKPGDNVGYWTILSNDGDKFRCRCICGTERVIKHNILKSGRSLSCGCRRSDHQIQEQTDGRKLGQKIAREIQKYGLSMSYAGFGRKKNKNSGTGITGVSKWKDRYRAYITVDRKQIHLGIFKNLENAIEARKNAEKRYFLKRQKIVDKIKKEVMQKELELTPN